MPLGSVLSLRLARIPPGRFDPSLALRGGVARAEDDTIRVRLYRVKTAPFEKALLDEKRVAGRRVTLDLVIPPGAR